MYVSYSHSKKEAQQFVNLFTTIRGIYFNLAKNEFSLNEVNLYDMNDIDLFDESINNSRNLLIANWDHLKEENISLAEENISLAEKTLFLKNERTLNKKTLVINSENLIEDLANRFVNVSEQYTEAKQVSSIVLNEIMKKVDGNVTTVDSDNEDAKSEQLRSQFKKVLFDFLEDPALNNLNEFKNKYLLKK